MPRILRFTRRSAVLAGFSLIAGVAFVITPPVAAQSDLDAFMQQVLARRDDNWKKLQQYILDERETFDLRGPGHVSLESERREYTWYIRDGFFVRSPVKVNGVAIGEADRTKYEREFLQREKERDKRQAGRERGSASAKATADETADKSGSVERGLEDPGSDNVHNLILQTRQPQFISSAYFLRFKFEQGKYALVGREPLDGRETLRIEYYPASLFSREQARRQRRRQAGNPDPSRARQAEMERMLNKVSRVTLWIDRSSHQIVKYIFDNIAFDFLPARWLVRVDDLTATMTMSQPFPDVWLPRTLEMAGSMTLAVGQFDVRYAHDYHDYRRADVTSKVGIPGGRKD